MDEINPDQSQARIVTTARHIGFAAVLVLLPQLGNVDASFGQEIFSTNYFELIIHGVGIETCFVLLATWLLCRFESFKDIGWWLRVLFYFASFCIGQILFYRNQMMGFGDLEFDLTVSTFALRKLALAAFILFPIVRMLQMRFHDQPSEMQKRDRWTIRGLMIWTMVAAILLFSIRFFVSAAVEEDATELDILRTQYIVALITALPLISAIVAFVVQALIWGNSWLRRSAGFAISVIVGYSLSNLLFYAVGDYGYMNLNLVWSTMLAHHSGQSLVFLAFLSSCQFFHLRLHLRGITQPS